MKAVLGLAVAMAALACLGAQGALPPPDEHAPGADLHDVPCCGERVLVGSPDGRPACVTPCSARTLLERGWHETDPPGPGHMPATPTKTMTVQSGPWTAKPWGADLRGAGEKLSTLISGPYVPCILPSSLSVEVPEEAAVGKPFDVTITPSFELTPQQLQDFNELYETDFESARDMWESACDSEKASYYIKTPATYRPSGYGVSHVDTTSTHGWYPPYAFYTHHVDRKFQFGGGSTTVQMTIDEPVIFRVSDVDDRGNQDYFKFDFGEFWVVAGTHPIFDLGQPITSVYTDIEGDRISLSDSEFAKEQAGTGEPGPDDQFVPVPTPRKEADSLGAAKYGPGQTIIPEQEYGNTSLLRPLRDGETQTYRDIAFWSIIEHSMHFQGDAVHPATVISAWDLGEEYLENFLNEYPEYRAGAPAYAAPHQAEPPGPQDQDIWVSSDVPFEWIAELLEGDFEGEDPAELIERFGLDDEYVAGFLEAYPQYGGQRAPGAQDSTAAGQQNAAADAQSSRANLAFVTGKIKFAPNAGPQVPIHGVKVCAYDASDVTDSMPDALYNGRTQSCSISSSTGNFRIAVPLTDLQGGTSTPDISTKSFFENHDFKIVKYDVNARGTLTNETSVHQSIYSAVHL